MTFRIRKIATACLLSGSALALAACGTTGGNRPKYAIIQADPEPSYDAQVTERPANTEGMTPPKSTTRHSGVERPIGSTPAGEPYKAEAKKPKKPKAERRYASKRGQSVGKPYQIKGQWYYPAHQPDYDEKGIASWYGDQFHGRKTANGERFDMNEISAAHKTLPLNSMVEVTNLENGKSMTLRINDRGPFIDGRIIDLSRQAAIKLGMMNSGTARVRVRLAGRPESEPRIEIAAIEPEQETVEKAPKTPKAALPPIGGWAASMTPVVYRQASSEPEAAPKPAPVTQAPIVQAAAKPTPRLGFPSPQAQQLAAAQAQAEPEVVEEEVAEEATPQAVVAKYAALTKAPPPTPVQPVSFFKPAQRASSGAYEVQAGLFAVRANADRAASMIKGSGAVEIRTSMADGSPVYRVLVGSIPDAAQAIRVREEVADAGFADARVISPR